MDIENAIDLTEVKQSEWNKYIGNGYRSCHYTIVPVAPGRLQPNGRRGHAQYESRIILLGYDVNGNPQTFICPHKPHIKYTVKYPTKEKDIFGRYVETRYFDTSKQRKAYLDACNGTVNVIECLPPEKEFLHKLFDSHALSPDFNTQTLRIHYLDIETEMSAKFEPPKTAYNRINMITIFDSLTQKFYTWTTGDCEVDFKEEPLNDMPKDKFVLFKFYGSEDRMLRHFLNWTEENRPDCYQGWNIQGYDMPYIVNRIERVLGNPENIGNFKLSQVTKRLSPVGRIRIYENNTENERANKQAEVMVDISGVFIADGLILYRDKFKIQNPLDGGHGLSNVGEAEGLGRKLEYKGNLKELYEKDFQRFYEYNVRDVDLCKRIEDKVKMIPLARLITSFGLSDYNSIYSSIGYLVGSLVQFAKEEAGGLIFTSYKSIKEESEKYEGAFVFEPIPGLYVDGIAVVDYNSLYPNTIISLNLSPETYVGKISRYPIGDDREKFKFEDPIDIAKDVQDTYYMIPLKNGPQKTIKRSELLKLLNEKCILSRNNALFLKHGVKKGVLTRWCEHFYNLRKATKKEMKKLEMKLYKNEIVGEDAIKEAKARVENLDSRQQALKIMINSIYGMIGTPHSPIYNIYAAQSITRGGKFCNTRASKFINEKFNERFGMEFAINPSEENRAIVGLKPGDTTRTIGGDTDSCIASTTIFIKRPLKQ